MLPEAFQDRMRLMLGKEYEAFLETFGEQRNQALRLNALKRNMEGQSAAGKYGAANEIVIGFAHLAKVPWAENGYYYQPGDQPGKHPLHEAGLYYIQEPSAMAPAELLDVKPGDRVLDLCAAPGGKSTQIAAKLQGKGLLVCNEIHPARAKILSENIERMGICNACVTNEPPERLEGFFAGFFDKILVDAPCSGEGMFRKNEEACKEWSPENVALCAGRQDGILDRAAAMLRPGGKLVYSTCTFAPEENEGSISRFLQRHGEFSVLPIEKERMGLAGCDGVPAGAAGLEHTLRIWPQRVRGEGHFAALLQKAGGELGETMPVYSASADAVLADNADRKQRNPAKKVTGKTKKAEKNDSELEVFFTFCRENIRFAVEEAGAEEQAVLSGIGQALGLGENVQMIRFGENLYLAPPQLPSLRGLKVLRPGLHLGELKKNRFEPSHALALALPPEYGAHVWNLDSREPVVACYLKGQTFPAEGDKGWYLVCVDGFSIGWGKLAGGTMKNHYPIGLRWKGERGLEKA